MMMSRPSVLMFSSEEFEARAVKTVQVEEYRPDAANVRTHEIRARQKVSVKGISNDGRLVIRLDSKPLPLLVHPRNIRISSVESAENCVRHYAALLNQDPNRFLQTS